MEQFLYTLLEPAVTHHTLKGYVLNSWAHLTIRVKLSIFLSLFLPIFSLILLIPGSVEEYFP